MLTSGFWLLASGFWLLVVPPTTRGETPADKKTLSRTEDPVVVVGARLPRLKGVHKDQIRLFACRNRKLEPIPFQIDERTPELNYCWTAGSDPVKDVDEGRLDDDDELVFMASDTGDRAPKDGPAPEGARARQEIELRDPATGALGWAYAFAFTDTAPAPSPVRYVSFAATRAGATLRGETFEIACEGSAGLTGRPTHVRLRGKDGLSREVVRDAARAHLRASYLFVHIDRDGAEARTSLGTSYIEGPVRVVAPLACEAYLVWGNWITAVRSVVFVTRSRWELRTRVAVPVSFDATERSDAWLALDLPPDLGGFSFRNDRNPRALSLGAGLAPQGLDVSFPSWNVVFGPEGSIVSGLRLDPRLASARNGLHFRPGADGRGAQVGFAIDLTGLKKSDEASPYEIDAWVGFAPAGEADPEKKFVAIDDAPLVQNFP